MLHGKLTNFVLHYQDTDHCVREACHGAMKHFVSKVKREFAPSLKMVIGYWVCGMSDPNLSVSASARDAFDVAFSKEKQVEVYKFAFNDILSVSLLKLMYHACQHMFLSCMFGQICVRTVLNLCNNGNPWVLLWTKNSGPSVKKIFDIFLNICGTYVTAVLVFK